MSPEFDPYQEWLSIPPNERPINYYRLLGVPLFESNTNVISNAADRQMSYVRTFQTGQYSQQSQQLLNELSQARVTLLDVKKKAEYDAKLRAELKSRANGGKGIASSLGSYGEEPPAPPQWSNNYQGSNVPSSPNRSELAFEFLKKHWIAVLSAFVAVQLLICGGGLLAYLLKPSKTEVVQNAAEQPRQPEPTEQPRQPESPEKPQKTEKPKKSEKSKKPEQSGQSESTEKSEPPEPTEQPQGFEPGKEAGDRIVKKINGVEFAFRWCPPGAFTVGSPESEEGRFDDEIQYQVKLTKGFWMLETEVTQKQWKAVMRSNPSNFKGDDLPMEEVSWNDCRLFCKKCTQLGLPVQIPTKEQWEYACRAGTTGAYAGDLDEMAWYDSNSGSKTHPVGKKKPNAWGLYDMHGNVWEWCQDSIESEKNLDEPLDKPLIYRGGSWSSHARYCRSAFCYLYQVIRRNDIGFRCASSIDDSAVEYVNDSDEGNGDGPDPPVINFYKNAGKRVVMVVNGVDFAFRWCPAGTFMMGSPESEKNRFSGEKQHQVTLTKGFWMLETEVTQEQWKAVMGTNPSRFEGDDQPVEQVSWSDCQEFCKKCTQLGLPVQLPTEAQWEYACRAGTTDAYAGNLDEMAWYGNYATPKGTSKEATTHPVGTKKPNAWGLYDMYGNVWEWCLDGYAPYPDGKVTDPEGPKNGSFGVRRGGDWSAWDRHCRSAYRSGPGRGTNNSFGFRCVSTDLGVSITGDNNLPGGKIVVPGKLIADKKAGDRIEKTINGVTFAFRWCPPGTFTMGSPESEDGRKSSETRHQVALTKGFWMMETEVTQKQWEVVMDDNPGHFIGEDLPVEQVSWNDCQEFCNKCAQLGLPVRLPTEAQWEYACRAGTTTAFAGDLDKMSWNNSNSRNETHPVGKKKANAWGLYDMHGNVMEWCQDWYSKEYPIGNVTNPSGALSGSGRVFRGGSWFSDAPGCRSANRGNLDPDYRDYILGFRCVSSVDLESSEPVKSDDGKKADDGKDADIAKNADDGKNADVGKNAGDRDVKTVNGVEFAFRWCPAGTFMMGSPESEEGRIAIETQHKETLTKGFWMLETEVTQKQWKAVMGNNPSEFKGDDLPVEKVSWNDCQEFCKKCTQLGLPVQLPTEAQWEYACRAGTTGAYAGNLDEMAWYHSNSGYEIHPVGTKKPNAWGLYDMHGNVGEWCQDWIAETDPFDPLNGFIFLCVFRGGSRIDAARYCRSASFRSATPDADGFSFQGFRVVLGQ